MRNLKTGTDELTFRAGRDAHAEKGCEDTGLGREPGDWG